MNDPVNRLIKTITINK